LPIAYCHDGVVSFARQVNIFVVCNLLFWFFSIATQSECNSFRVRNHFYTQWSSAQCDGWFKF